MFLPWLDVGIAASRKRIMDKVWVKWFGGCSDTRNYDGFRRQRQIPRPNTMEGGFHS